MSNLNLRNITNNFQDVRLVSLATWRQANEIQPRDRGGPYVIVQEGMDPEDSKASADEFVLGRAGKWLSPGFFFKLPVEERRVQFIFGTVAEVMEVMNNLPSKVAILRPGAPVEVAPESAATDEMASAFQAARGKSKDSAS
jgi:hypothetical protein